jgi:hypothetical protein
VGKERKQKLWKISIELYYCMFSKGMRYIDQNLRTVVYFTDERQECDGLKFGDALKQQMKERGNNRESRINQELKRLSMGDIWENGLNNMNILIRISERLY